MLQVPWRMIKKRQLFLLHVEIGDGRNHFSVVDEGNNHQIRKLGSGFLEDGGQGISVSLVDGQVLDVEAENNQNNIIVIDEGHIDHNTNLVHETDEEELLEIFEQGKQHFPSPQEIKNAQIFPVSALEEGHVYFVLQGKKIKVAYENERGGVERGDSILLKVVGTVVTSHLDRVNIRLTGISHEKFVVESRWDKYLRSDGTMESKVNPGKHYNRINVLHRRRGEKQFRIDVGVISCWRNKRKTIAYNEQTSIT